MEVALLHYSPIGLLIRAIRTCYNSECRSDSYVDENFLGKKDLELVKQIIDSQHHSVLEHLVYSIHINGISRSCLQELARHRIASFSVKSTRYTLGRIKNESGSFLGSSEGTSRSSAYLVITGNSFVDYNSRVQLEEVRLGAIDGIPNDMLKMMLPESFKTTVFLTINARSLRNFLSLRLDTRAHWEIRELAQLIMKVIPETHALIFEDIVSSTSIK